MQRSTELFLYSFLTAAIGTETEDVLPFYVLSS